jgi:hypothetical protein
LLLEKESVAGVRRTGEQGTRINLENDEGSCDIVGATPKEGTTDASKNGFDRIWLKVGRY